MSRLDMAFRFDKLPILHRLFYLLVILFLIPISVFVFRAILGGNWNNGSNAGAFYWNLNNGVGNRNRNIGARKKYINLFK